ncbi:MULTISPECIES: precorrin-2 dehydrogenase/sirohydrochlorin ferrochelatase family protein [Cellulophaga]|uniref:precorrin-2 dehydrogenase n=2 Tax=Cellulophaga TaxID=104264 RepID=F0RD95_CELLC|nr:MULTISPECIES: bifunctional precorrin-2 dehydrogenase/sirohydrochlorin ferrochelatase [Cellulophaga]ADY29796.1 siroheme synthase [Cellulophaga lytica DSM 7489]AIM60795.1 siroheme synthase [Cellulophaga lytica]EWH15156.1 siroheme synthase [Cellulophaga geojensis KL-A]MDO6854500.1 bifunctional precorrin-2 dehydrogenase/sirohydrochlorin ferrochelatase [Cellulophaga lytica]TVZ07655.1 precorrin-2 dehydrogenase/sirohydrochlorin ferrochelatase [Cellulophaga sp. RHA_52]
MERNNLYPVFLKTSQLHVLIVGGGNVAEEKLRFLTKSSPDAVVTMVSPWYAEKTLQLANKFNVTTITDVYNISYLDAKHMVVATTDNVEVNVQVYKDCRAQFKLVNVADNPPYCDFYMGGIVTKGNVKIGISTNGKSPTTAKRLRQFFEDVIPEDINKMVQNLNDYRKTIKGDFEEKVDKMNQITSSLVDKKDNN